MSIAIHLFLRKPHNGQWPDQALRGVAVDGIGTATLDPPLLEQDGAVGYEL